jgi:hypothetical protein
MGRGGSFNPRSENPDLGHPFVVEKRQARPAGVFFSHSKKLGGLRPLQIKQGARKRIPGYEKGMRAGRNAFLRRRVAEVEQVGCGSNGFDACG